MSGVMLNKIDQGSSVNTQAKINSENAQKIQQTNSNTQVQKTSKNEGASATKKTLSPQELKKVIAKINENVSILNKDVKFVYNEAIKSLVVKVIDAKTGKVIREIPPKEVINLQKKLSEVVGIIFDSKEVSQ